MTTMAFLLPILAAFFFLGLSSVQGLPTSKASHVTSGVAPERGLHKVTARSSGVKALTKRDISLNQDLKSLANMLLAREYDRILSNRMNREFLRKIGKRGSSSLVGGFEDVMDLLPGEPQEDSLPSWWKCSDCDEENKFGRNSAPSSPPPSPRNRWGLAGSP
uniref:ELH n=1 Tax=Charonia tritonis TaxID=1960912 RepID=A0A1S6JQ11_9CAEN|nr:ELH precursor [Charonia tritonis]